LRFLAEVLSPIAHASVKPKEYSPEGAMPWTSSSESRGWSRSLSP